MLSCAQIGRSSNARGSDFMMTPAEMGELTCSALLMERNRTAGGTPCPPGFSGAGSGAQPVLDPVDLLELGRPVRCGDDLDPALRRQVVERHGDLAARREALHSQRLDQRGQRQLTLVAQR